jgi:predicted nucleic acid-binding protein
MPKACIPDTSCFILLSKIGELDLLQKLYSSVITTDTVAAEFGLPLPEWIQIQTREAFQRLEILELQIDPGEASVVSLAMDIEHSVLVLDDYKARKIATRLGLTITGTVGVIVKAKLQGHIPSVKAILEKLRKTDFRLSEEIELAALREAGEL